MLTVRHINPDNKQEFLFEVTSVWKREGGESASGNPCISWRRADGMCEDVFRGTIYVMNELGKTIAKYELYPEPISTKGE
jgi:hypothetical protein